MCKLLGWCGLIAVTLVRSEKLLKVYSFNYEPQRNQSWRILSGFLSQQSGGMIETSDQYQLLKILVSTQQPCSVSMGGLQLWRQSTTTKGISSVFFVLLKCHMTPLTTTPLDAQLTDMITQPSAGVSPLRIHMDTSTIVETKVFMLRSCLRTTRLIVKWEYR